MPAARHPDDDLPPEPDDREPHSTLEPDASVEPDA